MEKTREQWQIEFTRYIQDYFLDKKGRREIKVIHRVIGKKKKCPKTVVIITKGRKENVA